MLGKEVMMLVNETKQAGYYDVEFSSESVGGGLASGIYFYRLAVSLSNPLEAGGPSTSSGRGFKETKRMMMIK